ncbi:ATP-binding protein [Neobacillus niacini]|uniref:ATP-binding protein n=1 Tax=Neobacillus niacini TaxID=86668 RepID=UPI003B02C7D2
MLGIYISIILVVLILFVVISNIFLRKVLEKKQKESEENYREMVEKYEVVIRNLENKIVEEAEKNSQRDHFLIQQSRRSSMDEIFSTIGYQWQEPLNSLSLLIQDVREALQFSEINDQYINTFTKEGMNEINFMSRTINDLRKIYQPTKQKCTFSISDSIEKALSIFSYSLKNHDIHVEFEYREQHMAYGFPNEYSQVVLMILTNTRNAFVTNKVKNRKIDINIGTDDCFLVVDITDNAGPLEPAFLTSMFDLTTTTRNYGKEIGLFMTKIMIENMDGSVAVKNTENGVQFRLTVPKAAS